MRKAVFIILLCTVFIAGCKKEVKTLGDNFTDNTSVTSIIESREPAISEGNTAFLRGDFKEALSYYETGLKQNRSVAYYNMGVSYYMMHNILEAEKYFRLSVENDPSFDEAVMNLVAVLAEQEKTIEAEKYLEGLVNKKKTARVYVDMANLSLKNGSTAKATYYYEKAVKIDNESQFILSNYANFLISIGQLDDGERILNSIPDKDFTILYNLANIELMKGNPVSAYELANKTRQQDDGSEEGYNKLATLYAALKKYPEESQTLRMLIMWNPKKEYRLRLVKSYLRGWNLDMADDESQQLMKDYPNDIDVIIAYYDVMIAQGKIPEAGTFIRDKYKQYSDDMLLYMLVRHISLYDRTASEAARLISGNRQTPLLNLARAAYYLRMNSLKDASQALSKVPENSLNDYYIYMSFLLFKEKDFHKAEMIADKIDPSKPEYFWYHFMLAWNLRKPERILKLASDYKDDHIISTRVPLLNYNLTPVKEDMSFTYSFDGTGIDVASYMMYPFFIEPDEVYSFLAMGYRMLKENEEKAALKQLEKFIEYSDAVRINNDGVVSLLNFDYQNALKKFIEVEAILTTDPFVQYNIGLVNYANGDYAAAYQRFAKATQLNRYLVPAHVGKGLALVKLGRSNEAEQHFDAALLNADEYIKLANQDIVLPMITRAKYLAMLAQSDTNKVIQQAQKEKNKDNFIIAVTAIAKYLQSQNPAELVTLKNTGVYHSEETAYLLSLLTMPISDMKELPSDDRNTVLAAKYIFTLRTKSYSDQYLARFFSNNTVLTELVNLSVLTGDRAEGLDYLQTLGKRDISYPPQYKSSFYYFMWVKNFVDAEGSFVTLDNLNYYDQDVHYYRMLFYLLNYNKDRLFNQIDGYIRLYPREYRGQLMMAMQQLQDHQLTGFLSSMIDLLSMEPYLFNKMPLEIEIERF